MKSIGIYHHTQPLSTVSNEFHRLSRHAPPPVGGLQGHFPNHVIRTKPMAVTSSHLVVLSVSQPAAGDISVLIPTSIAFIILYWIANFVVPAMIMKDLESDDANENQNPN